MSEENLEYSNEPEEVFQPLPETLACELYDLEMDRYSEDIHFYNTSLPKQGTFLELGCGSGRLTRALASTSRRFIGLDLSHTMLLKAAASRSPKCNFIRMDMRKMAFSTTFNAIIIPYNTLNLLVDRKAILSCLRSCRQVLAPGGTLLLQLHIPSQNFCEYKKRTFQFLMLDNPSGGKVIKEILKKYITVKQQIHIEERYRIRPMTEGKINEDWKKDYSIAGFSTKLWLTLFTQSGFILSHSYGDFDLSPFHHAKSTKFLAILK